MNGGYPASPKKYVTSVNINIKKPVKIIGNDDNLFARYFNKSTPTIRLVKLRDKHKIAPTALFSLDKIALKYKIRNVNCRIIPNVNNLLTMTSSPPIR